MQQLLLLGGGHSHIEVLRRFALDKAAGAALTLVSPEAHAIYSGMLPGVIAGIYSAGDCRIGLAALSKAAGARFVRASAVALDPRHRRVTLDDGSRVEYDALSIDVGSTAAAAALQGVREFALATRPADAFIAACDALAGRTRAGAIGRVAVVGGGAAGVEITLALAQRLRRASSRPLAVALITDQPHLLDGFHPRAQRLAGRALRARGIDLHLQRRVSRVEAAAVVTDTGRIETDAVVWATGPAAPAWLAGGGLALDARGFIEVDTHLQSTSHPGVFAAGDCASLRGQPHPKSGVYAVRQGPPLAENLRRHLDGRALLEFRPQPRALALLASGDGRAMGAYGALAFEGAWVWRWKDFIDRGFVARYRSDAAGGAANDQSKA